MQTDTLADLIARLEKCEGPDRQLDYDLTAAFYPGEPLQWPDQYKAPSAHWQKRPVELLTFSTDAALSLMAQLLPAFGLQIGHPTEAFGARWYASVFMGGAHFEDYQREGDELRPIDSYRPNGAIALLLALIHALAAQRDTGEM